MKALLKSFIAISILSAALVSHASEDFYFGVNIGRVNYDVTLDDLAVLNDGSITSVSINDRNITISLILGYQLTPNLSFEGGYVDLSNFTVNATSDGSGSGYAAGPVELKAATGGLFFDIKGQLPLNREFGLYGKFGVLKWDSKVTIPASTLSTSSTTKADDTFFGVGVSYNVRHTILVLNADYTFYELEGIGVDAFTVGMQLGF